MRHFKRARNAAAAAEVIAIIYNFLPSFLPSLPNATRRIHKAVYDHSCSQSVSRRNRLCKRRCGRPRLRGLQRIVAKTYEARNKIYAVVFLNARRLRPPVLRWRFADVDKSCLSICERPALSMPTKETAPPLRIHRENAR